MRLRHALIAAVVALGLTWGASNASAQIFYRGVGFSPYPGGYFPPPAYNYNTYYYPNQAAYSSYSSYGRTYSYRPVYTTPYNYGSVVYPTQTYRSSYYYPGGSYYNYSAPLYYRYR